MHSGQLSHRSRSLLGKYFSYSNESHAIHILLFLILSSVFKDLFGHLVFLVNFSDFSHFLFVSLLAPHPPLGSYSVFLGTQFFEVSNKDRFLQREPVFASAEIGLN